MIRFQFNLGQVKYLALTFERARTLDTAVNPLLYQPDGLALTSISLHGDVTAALTAVLMTSHPHRLHSERWSQTPLQTFELEIKSRVFGRQSKILPIIISRVIRTFDSRPCPSATAGGGGGDGKRSITCQVASRAIPSSDHHIPPSLCPSVRIKSEITGVCVDRHIHGHSNSSSSNSQSSGLIHVHRPYWPKQRRRRRRPRRRSKISGSLSFSG